MALAAAVNEKTPVGTPIDAKVTGPAVEARGRSGSRQKSEEAVIPTGAVVHGRVRRVERQPDAGKQSLLALEFTDVEWNQGHQRFFADLESVAHVAGVDGVVTAGSPPSIALPDLPGVAYLMVHDGAELPAGFALTWKTQSLIR
jgi:hypothetical protein